MKTLARVPVREYKRDQGDPERKSQTNGIDRQSIAEIFSGHALREDNSITAEANVTRVSRLMALLAGLGVLLMTAPVGAHHSTAMYDGDNPVTITGKVIRFEWTNPHAFVYLEVEGQNGSTVEWEVEMMSLNHLRAYGWTSRTVKPGEVISCTGAPARSGDPAMIANRMILADGREIRS